MEHTEFTDELEMPMRHDNEHHASGVTLRSRRQQQDSLPALLCLSHLRWNFVFQRPQHLMVRWARERRVYFVEEPLFQGKREPGQTMDGGLVLKLDSNGVVVATPHLPEGLSPEECVAAQRRQLDRLITSYRIKDYVLWYYTPMALSFSRHLSPRAVVYDCMDELSAFAGAPRELRELEAELFRRADAVMTGGYSLYEAKRTLHRNIHPFPSSVDAAHFARARERLPEPEDQVDIPHPRLGFFGVIDERMDLDLLDGIARLRPDWHLVMLGPVVKIDPARLPRRSNIHYLGMKPYAELPAYLSGWDVALLPFARNESTRFISPTKTPEYLAAGKPVVSTSIRDVVYPYGQQGLVRIADGPADFVQAVDAALSEDFMPMMLRVDTMLAQTSWDLTWERMKQVVDGSLKARRAPLERRGGPCLTI